MLCYDPPLSPRRYRHPRTPRGRVRALACAFLQHSVTRVTPGSSRGTHDADRGQSAGGEGACVVDGSGPVPGVDPGLNSLFWGEAPGLRNPGSNRTAPVAAPDCPAAAGLLALGASAKSSTSIGPVSADGDPALSPTRRSPGGESILYFLFESSHVTDWFVQILYSNFVGVLVERPKHARAVRARTSVFPRAHTHALPGGALGALRSCQLRSWAWCEGSWREHGCAIRELLPASSRAGRSRARTSVARPARSPAPSVSRRQQSE